MMKRKIKYFLLVYTPFFSKVRNEIEDMLKTVEKTEKMPKEEL